MKTINTDDLIDSALDYAVALAAGVIDAKVKIGTATACACVYDKESRYMFSNVTGRCWSPSKSWDDAGYFIHNEKIDIIYHHVDGTVSAVMWFINGTKKTAQSHGLTPLVAAMRCYVKSKLGDTVDIPNEVCDVS